MPISTTDRKAGPFVGDDVTTEFPFGFKVFAKENLLVVRADANGAEEELTLDTDFTVVLNANQDEAPGGSATLSDALASGYTLVISSNLENLQPTDLSNQGGFYPRVITDALDRLTILIQQITEQVKRSLKMALTAPAGVDSQLPAPSPYQLIGWNGDGTGFQNTDPTYSTALATDLKSTNSGKGGALVGFIQPGAGASARTVMEKLREIVSVEDFGAIGNGVADDTAAIQAAIDYVAANRGGTVNFAAKIYRITATITARSYVRLRGKFSETNVGGGTADGGTKLVWAGAANGTMLTCFNVRLFELRGFVLDGASAATVTGILLDSNNNPSGSQNEFHQFSIRNCYVGVKWGTSGIGSGAYANDGTRFSTFTIWSDVAGSKGFIINSGNAGQMSVIESGGIQVQDLGIDIVVANLLQIRRTFGGGVMDTGFIRTSIAIDVLIEGCSSECWGTGKTWRTNRPKFLKVVAPVETYPIIESTITLVQNQINNPILIDYPVRVTSVGDAWGYCKDYTTSADIPAKGEFTNSTAASGRARCVALNNGVNPGSIDLTTNEPTMGWIDSNYVDLSNYDPGRGWVAPAFNAANFTASGSMVWTVEAGDVETLAYTLAGRTMTVAFKLNTTTLSGAQGYVLHIKIPNGKTATKGVSNLCKVTAGAATTGVCAVGAGGTTIDFQPVDYSLWTLGTNNVALSGQITFEVN